MPTWWPAGSRVSFFKGVLTFLPGLDDFVNEGGAAINEAGVELHEGGPGRFLGKGVLC